MKRIQSNLFLLFLVTALAALALAGTVAAGGDNASTGWTWDDGVAVESPDGWTWDDGAMSSTDGWTWDEDGVAPG
jgi:hypothetical protein